jgi:acetyltransferase-like isoleucine patch superfamily enzyme
MAGFVSGPICIGPYSFIGPHSTIMPNTTIGKGSIVTAYSYVRGEFPDFAIISGNPATVIGSTQDRDRAVLTEHPELKTAYDAWAHNC